IVPGCEIRRGLQIDHTGPYVETRYTGVDALARLCRWHHYLKSHCGYTYRGGPGTWEWVPPDRGSLSPRRGTAERLLAGLGRADREGEVDDDHHDEDGDGDGQAPDPPVVVEHRA